MSYVKAQTHQVDIKGEQINFIESALLPLAQSTGIGIRIINASGNAYTFNISKEKELCIFVNSSSVAGTEDSTASVNGIQLEATKYLKPNTQRNIVFNSDEGLALIEYFPDLREMKILFDLFSDVNYDHIFKEFLPTIEKVLLQIKHDGEWEYMDKNALVAPFVEQEKKYYEDKLRRAKQNLKSAEEQILYYRQQMIKENRDMKTYMVDVEKYSSQMDDEAFKKNLIKEFDLINKDPKVKSFKIEGTYVHIYTHPIDAYHDVSGDRYHIGEFIVRINLRDGDVKYKNLTNRRRSHWGAECHHPHVSDTDWGNPCLGNISETVADLINSGEYYALTIIAIDFLENVNTDDPAGKFIVNWDKVDDSGSIVQEGKNTRDPGEDEAVGECFFCDDAIYDEDEMNSVGVSQRNGEVNQYECACNGCYDDMYYNDHVEETVDEETHDDLNNYHDPYVLVITSVDSDGETDGYDETFCRESEKEDYNLYYDDELEEYVTQEVHDELEKLRAEREED